MLDEHAELDEAPLVEEERDALTRVELACLVLSRGALAASPVPRACDAPRSRR
jgi:hypothetical protein